jgi:chromate transporter
VDRPSLPNITDVERPSLLKLFLSYLRVTNLTFGGGTITMAALHTELVSLRKWLSQEKYATVYALARITPGTNMLAFCAGTAWELLGWPGAIASVAAASVPTGIIVMLLTGSYDVLRSNQHAMAAVAGTLAAAVGIMAMASWELIKPYLDRKHWMHAVALAGGSVVLSLKFDLTPIAVLGLAAVLGCIWRVPE